MCVDAGTAVAAFDGNITFRLDLEGGDAGATTNLEVRHTPRAACSHRHLILLNRGGVHHSA